MILVARDSAGLYTISAHRTITDDDLVRWFQRGKTLTGNKVLGLFSSKTSMEEFVKMRLRIMDVENLREWVLPGTFEDLVKEARKNGALPLTEGSCYDENERRDHLIGREHHDPDGKTGDGRY